jgi:hypothetical protein
MEDRVEYTEENHDGNFMKFYEQLTQYVKETSKELAKEL